MTWLRFFIGTPQRLMRTLLVIVALVVFSHLYPGTIANGLHQLVWEIQPIVGPILTLVLVVIGIRIILTGIGRR